MKNEDLREIHKIEMDIMDKIDQFCRDNDIRYSLYCGTMLGAVRHGGFIPWDDDIDICMLRSDYNKFIDLWRATNNKEYIIQNKDTDANFTQSFTKIRKNKTTFIEEGEKGGLYHNGIFVDVLPLDRIPDSKIDKIKFKWNLMKYLLFTREFIPPEGNSIVKLVSSIFLSLYKGENRSKARHSCLKKIKLYNNDTKLKLVSANSLEGLKHEMPAELPNNYQQIEFEDRKYMCYEDCDGLLSAWYGSYMELPPLDQQVLKHGPVIVSFEKNYDELKENVL